MKILKKFLFLLPAFFLITACTQTTDKTNDIDDTTDQEDVIKIGFVGPLTGDIASIGNDMKQAIEMFFETKGNMIGDQKVELIPEDGVCNGQNAANAINKLVSTDKVKLVFGGACSGETLAMAPIAEKNKVLMITSASTNPGIRDAGDYVFRNFPADDVAAKQTIEDIQKGGYTNFAILTENTDFAIGFQEHALQAAEELNLEVVIDEVFNPQTTDFKTVLGKVKDNSAEVLIANTQTPAGAGLVVKQATELGLSVPIYSNNAVNGTEFFDLGGSATEGVAFYDVGLDETDPRVQKFLETAEREDINNFAFAASSYDAATILYNAIEEVGYDSDSIKKWLYDMPDFDGLIGTYKFDEDGDVSFPLVKKVAKDGEFVVSE